MSLSLQVKLINSLCIVDSLWINFSIANNNAFPDSFISLLEIYIQEFAVLNTPEGVLDFDFFTQLSLNEGFFSFETNFEVLRFYYNCKLICLCAFWDRNLDLNVKHSLSPVVFFSCCPVISCYLLHFFSCFGHRLLLLIYRLLFGFFLRNLRWNTFRCFLNLIRLLRPLFFLNFSFIFHFNLLLLFSLCRCLFLLFFSECLPSIFEVRFVGEPLEVLLLVFFEVRVNLLIIQPYFDNTIDSATPGGNPILSPGSISQKKSVLR